jgi:pimeloyl-ACP methyl ester carboxylesterase
VEVETGYLTVPESRSRASGGEPFSRTIRLFVAVVRSRSARRRPPPLVWLSGGPGGHSGGVLARLKEPLFRDVLLAERDLIIFDQRGTGYSKPSLSCPETAGERLAPLLERLPSNERRRRFVDAALRCRDRLVAEGVNLTAYNTVESAADIDDLRRALGYQQVDLYSISYGTRLALAVMRDHPAGIRSVILDSTVPMQVSQYAEGIANTAYSFDLLFERVAADPAAARAFPNLRAVYVDLARRLDAEPDLVTFPHPTSGDPVQLPITGELITGIFCQLFYSTTAIPTLPRLMFDLARGDYATVVEMVSAMLGPEPVPPYAEGMYVCVNCCDDKVSPAIAEQIAAQAAAHPGMAAVPLMEFHLGEDIILLCAAWGAREAGPAEREAVRSAVPTLILAGEYDQNTPASWGRLAGETLPNSWYVEFPGVGHGVLQAADGAPEMVRAFLNDPWSPPDARAARDRPGPAFG